jgi:hypothetical protein
LRICTGGDLDYWSVYDDTERTLLNKRAVCKRRIAIVKPSLPITKEASQYT